MVDTDLTMYYLFCCDCSVLRFGRSGQYKSELCLLFNVQVEEGKREDRATACLISIAGAREMH